MNKTKPQSKREKARIKKLWEDSGRTLELEWRCANDGIHIWMPDARPDIDTFTNPTIEVRVKDEKPTEETTPVTPAHYQETECRDALKKMLTPEQYIGWLRGDLFTYLWRCPNKNGAEDLKKAEVMLKWLIEEESH